MPSIPSLWRQHRGFLLFIGLMMVFRSAVADWNYVPSSSMNPTLVQGDRVLVNKLAYSLRLPFSLVHLARWAAPGRGDVITFDSPADEVNLIKRVVAVAGDQVAMRNNQLILNGVPLPRSLQDAHRQTDSELGTLDLQVWRESQADVRYETANLPAMNQLRDFDPVTVPAGHVLVLGDSRDNSRDSRYIGFIDVERITGRAERVVLSHDVARVYLPRAGRWWLPLHL